MSANRPSTRNPHPTLTVRSLGDAVVALVAFLVVLLPAATASAGGIFSWGRLGLTGAGGLTGITQIAAGGAHSVALKSDGTVVCWGNNDFGQTTIPAGLTGVVQVSAGEFHTVALKADGTVVCWGAKERWYGIDTNYGQCNVPAGLTGVVQVAAGGRHTVALKSDGTVVSWGSNSHGSGQSNTPAGLAGVVRIAAGAVNSVAQKADGTLVRWGWSSSWDQPMSPLSIQVVVGENGSPFWTVLKSDGTIESVGNPPAGPEGLSGITQIAANGAKMMALKSDGTVVTWGSTGTLGSVPAGLTGVVQIALGTDHAVALKSDGTVVAWGGIYCCGYEYFGSLMTPVGLTDVTQFDFGPYHLVAVKADGTVAAWGHLVNSATTVPGSLSGVTQVSAGYNHSAALKSDGTVACWGSNSNGQLNIPSGLSNVVKVEAGREVTVALKSDGSLVAWPPANHFGHPYVPSGIGAVTHLEVEDYVGRLGFRFTDGTILLRGGNNYGESTIPADLGSVSGLALGSFHTAARMADGTVRCWGYNGYGQCDVPAGLTGVVQIEAGEEHTVALKSDGTVVAWGRFRIPGGNHWQGAWVPENITGVQQITSSFVTIGALIPSPSVSVNSVEVPDCPQDDGAIDASSSHVDSVAWAGPDGFRATTLDLSAIGPGNYRLVGANRAGSAVATVEVDCLHPDTDGDGISDPYDYCPQDPAKTVPGTCGCGTPDADADGDGIVDCLVIANVSQQGLLPSAGVLIGDDFGASIATDGSFAVVGVPLDDLTGKANAGSARVFEWNGSSWVQVAELFAPSADAKANDNFGASVAIHGDVVVVGAPLSDIGSVADAGAAYVFRRSGSAWPFEQKLTRATLAGTDLFGLAVAVRGDFIAVGAPQANFEGKSDSGEVRVFKRASGAWTGTTAVSGVPSAATDKFGTSVALGGSTSAPTLVAGCPGDDQPSPATNCGAVYVRSLSSEGAVLSTTRLVGNPAIANAALGTRVAVDGDGLRVAGGAPGAAVSGLGAAAGSVTAWRLSGSTWSGVNLSPTGHAAGDRLGQSLAFDPTGATLVIGNSGRTVGGVINRGGAVVYSRLVNGSWKLHDRLLVTTDGTSASQFGFAAAAGPHGILLGGPKHNPPVGGTVVSFATPGDCASSDSDGDGTGDACDDCPSDASKLSPGLCGCGTSDTDSDGDAMANCYDLCPNDSGKTTPGECGCGLSEADTDFDGVKDCLDADDDDDGMADASDGCPLDPFKTSVGLCGCGTADTDTDGDATPNCNDLCPTDAGKVAPEVCGCGTADIDSDADGLYECFGQGILVETGTFGTVGVLTGDDFGAAVSGDGNFAAIGLPSDDLTGKANAGSARIAEWTGSEWVERAQLLAPSSQSKANDAFGASVSIQGDVAVVGAPTIDVDAVVDAGAAYVFRNVGGTWAFEARLTRPIPAATDKFGTSVSVLGDFIAVGGPLVNVSGKADAGEVLVFRRVSGTWGVAATVNASALAASDQFGASVSLGGSVAGPTLAVGCPNDDETGKTNCGAVYVHLLTSTGTVSSAVRVIAPTVIASAGLGTSVTVDATGNRVASGAPLADVPGAGNDCGSVVVWSLSGWTWSGTTLTPPDRIAGENFGRSVSLRADGAALVAGSPFDTVGGVVKRGSAAVFSLSGSTWSMHDRLTLPASGTSASEFGRAVSFRGTSILVGGPKHTPPAGGTVRSFDGP